MTLFTDCQKHSNVGMQSDVYKWIRFKLGMMIDAIVLYILILVVLTLTLSHRSVRKQKFLCQFSLEVFK